MADTRTISLDIETYGAAEVDWSGHPLPDQRYFHPARSLHQDHPHTLNLTAAITLTVDPLSHLPWSATRLAALEPGPTMVVELHRVSDRRHLTNWLRHANTILGMNLLFDLPYLRAEAAFRPTLSGTHTLIDLSILNYLESEVRTARSLKTLGPALRTHTYDPEATLKHRRFPAPSAALHYNAEDTHNTILAIVELARRILRDWGPTSPKCSLTCLTFYSSLIWSCVRMLESGIPLSRSALTTLRGTLEKTLDDTAALAAFEGILLNGDGSNKSKDTFIQSVAAAIDPTVLYNHPLLKLTEKAKKISWSDQNRLLFRLLLPDNHHYQKVLNWIDDNSHAQKLLGSYIEPLLNPRPSKPRTSVLLPEPPSTPLGDPSCSQPSSPPLLESSSLLSLSPASSSSLSTASLVEALPSSSQTSSPTTTPPAGCKSPTSWPSSSPQSPSAWAPSATSSPASRLPDVGLAYPTIYLVPSQFKDSSSDEGGQQQCRLSFKNPAAQTFPAPIKDCYASRFGPSGTIVSYDLAQAELRVAAILSGEPTLLDAFDRDIDLHATRAVETLGPSYFTKDAPLPDGWEINDSPGNNAFRKRFKTERQCFKHANFTDLNWGSALTLRRTILKKSGLLVPSALCEEAVRSRSRLRPVLWAWQNAYVAEAARNHYCLLPLTGQSRSFAGLLQNNDVNEVVNFPIQAIAALTMEHIQIHIHEHLPSLNHLRPPCHMFLNCYDALYFDCLTSYVPTLDRLVAAAVAHTQDVGYWRQICDHTGHFCRLAYSA